MAKAGEKKKHRQRNAKSVEMRGSGGVSAAGENHRRNNGSMQASTIAAKAAGVARAAASGEKHQRQSGSKHRINIVSMACGGYEIQRQRQKENGAAYFVKAIWHRKAASASTLTPPPSPASSARSVAAAAPSHTTYTLAAAAQKWRYHQRHRQQKAASTRHGMAWQRKKTKSCVTNSVAALASEKA